MPAAASQRIQSSGRPVAPTTSGGAICTRAPMAMMLLAAVWKTLFETVSPRVPAVILLGSFVVLSAKRSFQWHDLDRLMAEETGLPVLVAEDPLTCVVRGCGLALERMERLGSIFTSE